jgi:signal transduction histidine kinase
MVGMLAHQDERDIVPRGCLVHPHRGTPPANGGARFAGTVHRRHAFLLDAALPVVVAAVIVAGTLLHGGASARALPVAVVLAAAATLWARRRAPGWTLAVSGALVAVLLHIDASAGAVAVLAPAVALYSLAMARGRAQRLLAAAAAVGAVIVADALHSGRPTILQTLGHVMLVAIPLLAAEAMRTHRSYLSLLSERLDLAERTREQEAQRRAEQERMRIARELHDVVAHTLTTINVQAGAAAERLEAGDARKALETIEDASHEAIGELRAILGVLRDRDHSDAPRTPSPGVENIAELVQRARDAGLDVHLGISGDRPTRLSDAVSLAAYRIVQESLTNAHRHAAGAAIRVNVSFGAARLSIAVANGAGTGPGSNGAAPGVGIAGMLERASATGGTLHAGPSEDGFRVQAELPYELSR